jgi:cellulose synthase/poly-beta-1,6-N-acetylglucosamine synthase-like glycosyltransferase
VIILSILPALFTFFYILLLAYLIYHWHRIASIAQDMIPIQPVVSIIICARNEEEHILGCIQSCLDQSYPEHLTEIIVVDDQSEDSTYEIVEALDDPRVKLMRLGVQRRTTIKGSKKKALAYGINHAKGEIIFTTDADCRVPKDWVKNMVGSFSNQKIKLVSGPVKIIETKKFLNRFQALDFAGNGLVNAAGIQTKQFYLANAANLAYRREVFLEGDVFENNYNIASGDDVFLVEKIKTMYPEGIAFAKSKDSIVETHAMSTWRELIGQRLRWAGKMSFMKDSKLKLLPAFIWFQRVFSLGSLITGIVLKDVNLMMISFSCVVLQWVIDFILQLEACRFYNIKKWELAFAPIALLHSIYFILLGILSWLPLATEWKGRKV